jgi:hypothetical protein
VASYRLNTLILIILIQQPESSGSEVGESRVRNRVREILPTKHKSMTWDERLYFPSEGNARYGFLSPLKIRRPWPGRNL